MDLFIITGTTRGLGQALAIKALEQGNLVIAIARTSTIKHPALINIKHDLISIKGLEKKIAVTIKKIDLKKIKNIHLINNAAVIDPIGALKDISIEDMQKHLQVNVTSPMVLTKIIFDQFRSSKKMCTLLNISSGAARYPISGWSMYCSGKSALAMFTECLALDHAADKKIRFLDFAPGVIDTDMQATIRKQSASRFSRVAEFKDLKRKDLLLSADTVAAIILKLLADPVKISKTHYDVKEFL